MNLPFEPFADIPSLQLAVTDAFCELAKKSVSESGGFRVSLSGGSTPKRVYEMLADRDLPWDQIHWYWGDERNVPQDHSDSNYLMVKTALLDKVAIPESNIHPVPVNVESPDQAASAYERTLMDGLGACPPKFDLVLLGMGDDAHTASLFPETTALGETERSFVENWVPKFDAFRYTMTYPAIAAGKNIWFIITGSAKQDALKQVIAGESNASVYPSQRINPTRWFVSSDCIAS